MNKIENTFLTEEDYHIVHEMILGTKLNRKSDNKEYFISADSYGKGARYVELEPVEDGEIIWLNSMLVFLEFDIVDTNIKVK